jgi:hypothetical protein
VPSQPETRRTVYTDAVHRNASVIGRSYGVGLGVVVFADQGGDTGVIWQSASWGGSGKP